MQVQGLRVFRAVAGSRHQHLRKMNWKGSNMNLLEANLQPPQSLGKAFICKETEEGTRLCRVFYDIFV